MTQLRIGVIGTGGRSTIVKYGYNPTGNSIVIGAADVSMEALENFKKEINEDAFVTTDYREQPLTSPFAGRMSVAVGCAATESIRSGGKVVHIDQGKHRLNNTIKEEVVS
ncbi:hypothetical protein [Neobacillus niacini]|uniref:hypothetical protein n=1 Tax=Neobacillus niacini TaxID=86668 RepID=UPI0005ED885A|nr:hypothetical protein [Neobacillus niacini]